MSNNYLIYEYHFPPLDNQGSVNSCMSQSYTYIQFTNAISRKIDNENWNPSMMDSACFSSRFTYLIARSNAYGIYSFLKDHGCMTVDKFNFAKDSNGGSIEYIEGVPLKETVAWDVNKGSFKNALNYRVESFRTVLLNDLPSDDLIDAIKKSIDGGNVVVSTTSLENWVVSELSHDCGAYGKKGETIVIAARRYIPCGHSFAIVGYDDEITVDFSGITFKGAFLITCGYGTVWHNKGFVWMSYDAIFAKSTFDRMNDKSIYSGRQFFTYYYGNLRILAVHHLSNLDNETQDFVFTPVNTVIINDKKTAVYTIQAVNTKHYLCWYNAEYPDYIFLPDDKINSKWCLIPYEEIAEWDTFEVEYNRAYANSYWIIALDMFIRDPKSRCFIDHGLNYYDVGRIVGFSRFNKGQYPEAKSWIISDVSTDKSFVAKMEAVSEDSKLILRRTSALREFCFLDWENDVVLGLPELMVDIELGTVDRESFEVKMLRYDKDGNMEFYIPAMFRVYHTQYVVKPDVMSFSGAINAENPEIGHFTFQYSDLLFIPEGAELMDYQWGIEVISKNEHPVTIKSLTLVNAKGETLASISMKNGPVSVCKSSITFLFKT